MNNNLTELIMIIDMSGSMYELKSDTIGGYNSLIEQQKAEKGDAVVTTVLFNDDYIVLHDRKDIKEVELLTDKDYWPGGTTAMLDAIGRTLVSVGKKLASMSEEERPGKVMVTIITDGYENASKEYSWQVIKDMIEEQRSKYNWVFAFIGADIDNIQVSNNLGIDPRFSKKYTKSASGTASLYDSVSKSMIKMRSAASTAFAVDDMAEELSNIE